MKHTKEYKAVVLTRELGGSTCEEFEAYLEARKLRRMIEAEIDLLFLRLELK